MGIRPEGRLREDLTDELVRVEREIAKLSARKKAENKRYADLVAKQQDRRDELLDQLDGREGIQSSLPLASAPKNGAKAAPAPLTWEIEGANSVAEVPGGCYCIEPGLNPKDEPFTLYWTATGGKSKRLGPAPSLSGAKVAAGQDWLERGADAILSNSGDGKLVKGKRGRGAGAAP